MINFEQFLHFLKEASVRNPRGIKGNFLIDKNLYYESGIRKKNKSMDGRLSGLSSYEQEEETPIADPYIGDAQTSYLKSLRIQEPSQIHSQSRHRSYERKEMCL